MERTSHSAHQHGSSDEPLYQEIIKEYLNSSSIRLTAQKLHVSEVRVRKVLLTEELWSSRTSLLVQRYLDEGYPTALIAEKLSTSVKAVQQYLPYSRGIYMGENPSSAAVYSAEYRERIRIAKERVLKRKEAIMIQEGWSDEENHLSEAKTRHVLEANAEKINEIVMEGLPELFSVLGQEAQESPFEQYPGIVCFRQLPEGMVDWEKAKCRGVDVLRLHLELMRDTYVQYDPEDDGHKRQENPEKADASNGTDSAAHEYEETTRVLQSYGKVSFGDTISRDILVPADMPLYALHYAIQRLFGWENSHLHKFSLPPRRFLDVTDDNTGNWAELVGVLFRSPRMEEGDAFWADDYEYGSFKTWIRKKYTGPYMSLCHGEGIIQCKQDVEDIFRRMPVVKILYSRYEGKLEVADVSPIKGAAAMGEVPLTDEDKKNCWFGVPEKAVVCTLGDCPAQALSKLFMEERPDDLLERLAVEEVLSPAGKHPEDSLAFPDELLTSFEAFMDEDLKEDMQKLLKSGLDLPHLQPVIGTPTDVLYYNYDFGDDWMIRITASMDACDLVEQGRVTQQELDQAIAGVLKNYRPVCIAADGLCLVDDVGGLSGYTRFLRAINPTAEKEYWGKGNVPDNWSYEDKQSSLEWARGLGWTDRLNVKRLL